MNPVKAVRKLSFDDASVILINSLNYKNNDISSQESVLLTEQSIMLNKNIFNQTILEDYNKIKIIKGVETKTHSKE